MSDHVDGPRSIGEPAADITDLFAFTSPENPGHIVLAMCVFPYAGENAIFSNVIDYSIAVRRVSVAGIGNAARFQPADDEIRFSFRFETLNAAEFYAGSGDDCRRALELARTNVANRPTRRAIKRMRAIAVIADDASAAGDPDEPRAAQAAV